MVVFLVFIHQCKPTCPRVGNWVYHQTPAIDATSYAMPDLRCVYTNDALVLKTINGTAV